MESLESKSDESASWDGQRNAKLPMKIGCTMWLADIFNEQWHYYAGDSLSICLEFHGDKCDVLSEMITFH